MSRGRGPAAVNALIAVYKPAGMTSHDVVSRVRRAVGEKRVGHAGTLDPAATGVLVVGIGQATKLLGLLTLDRKGYRATFRLGAETTTDDAEGEVVRTAEVPHALFDEGRARFALEGLEGDFDQVPPAYSAVSVDGRRAYDRARSGEEVELAARHVTVYRARLAGLVPDEREWVVDLDVSKGTYVRSIARDLGRELGCYAHVSALERTFSGGVRLSDCVGLDELAERGAELVRERCLDPAALLGLPLRKIAPSEVADVLCGRRIEPGCVRHGVSARTPAPGERVALVWEGGLAGIWQRRGAHLVCESNFPQAVCGVAAPVELSSAGPERPLGIAGAAGWAFDPAVLGTPFRSSGAFAIAGCDVRGRVLSRIPGHEGTLVSAGAGGPDAAMAGARYLLGADPEDAGRRPAYVCAIGAFDGFHEGHRGLVARARREAEARGARVAAVTFSPDPAEVLFGAAREASDLLDVREREALLLEAGVDAVIEVEFTPQIAALDYGSFVTDALGTLVDLRALVVGSDFCMGAGGAGTVGALQGLGRAHGFDVVGMGLSDAGGDAISATRIRGLVRAGKVEDAASLLGRCHFVHGEVAHGRGEGTGFGFPTANVRVPAGRCLPAEGVYAGYVAVPGCSGADLWPAAVNVGAPRSFDGKAGEPFCEATLLGFEGDLYGREVYISFARWLRGPKVFSSLAELEATVLGNIDWTRRTFGDEPLHLEVPLP